MKHPSVRLPPRTVSHRLWACALALSALVGLGTSFAYGASESTSNDRYAGVLDVGGQKVKKSFPGGPNLTLADRCKLMTPAGSTINYFDRGTFGQVTLDALQVCLDQAALAPDPGGDLAVTYDVMNGKVHPEYFERTTEVVDGATVNTMGAPVPFDEAQQRIAAQRAARKY